MSPKVRQEIYDAYWSFAAERHAILLKRLRGEAPPWTQDPVLQEYRFCNTFRAADRVSQYLIRDVIYGEHCRGLEPEDHFLRVILFRLFSKESTWEALENAAGVLTRETFDASYLGDVLDELRNTQPIYTSAFILASPGVYGYKSKHRNHLALVEHMFGAAQLGLTLARASSLRQVFQTLVEFPAIGPFLAYQLTIDLNYMDFFSFCENDFTVPGPGAARGIKKVFRDPGEASYQQLIMMMVEQQDQEFQRLGIDFPGLFGRPLHAIDCQGLFCEVDKYSRQRFPDILSERQRIKHRYRPTTTLVDPPTRPGLFLPPKWGLNDS